MLRIFKSSAIRAVFLALLFLSPLSAVAQAAPQFQSEQEAQQHCPQDTVVWVNTKTEGAYECREEANIEGDRATRLRQGRPDGRDGHRLGEPR